MPSSLAEQIWTGLDHAGELYHRLILVVGRAGSGKSGAIREVAQRINLSVINVNLALSRSMLDLSDRQRALQVPRLLDETLARTAAEPVLLDPITILFDVALQQDPLRMLQGVARHRIVVAAWSGVVEQGQLLYAEPGHPEFRSYPAQDLWIVTTEHPGITVHHQKERST